MGGREDLEETGPQTPYVHKTWKNKTTTLKYDTKRNKNLRCKLNLDNDPWQDLGLGKFLSIW